MIQLPTILHYESFNCMAIDNGSFVSLVSQRQVSN